jgi:hypothetical protein
MGNTPKLSVDKALEKLRGKELPKSKGERHDWKMDALDEEIQRMKQQRLRLEHHQRRSTKRS